MLHPDFPVVEGEYQLTDEWSVSLPGKFNRRIEDDDLVIWRPGVTIWVAVWRNADGKTPVETLDWIRRDISPDAYDIEVSRSANVIRLSYRLEETEEQGAVAALYGFAIGLDSHVQMAIYLDQEADVGQAQDILRSVAEHDAR